MLLSIVSGVALALAHGVLAAATRHNMRVHEHRAHAPLGFTAVGKADAHAPLTLRLALKQRDTPGLIDALHRVSDPANADYGKHLSKEQVEVYTAPSSSTLAAVNAWLSDHGVQAKPVSPAGDWIEFTVNVSKANDLFDANFTVFKHGKSQSEGIRTLQYSIPDNLGSKIKALSPGVSFWGPASAPKFTRLDARSNTGLLGKRQLDCGVVVTPACLQHPDLYSIPATPATQSSNRLGVTGFTEQFPNQADLTQFLEHYRPDIGNATFTVQSLDGGSDPQDPNQAGIEADLDLEYTVGVATDVPVTFISVGRNTNDIFAGFMDVIIKDCLGEQNPPQVLTTSYGFNEDEFSKNMADVLCNAYAACGARGTSLIFASGDGGVSGVQAGTCTVFRPTFPAGCPFITSVGATTGIPETAAPFSSGGFSNFWPAPSYQTTAVSNYLAQIGANNTGLYKPTGRGFPDVAAMGDNILIAWRTLEGTVSGTSASAPIFASIIALINDRRVAAGKPPLGFLNPFLYANPHVFHDIITGNNPGCGTNGFPALGGWDPVTGLGTPDFSALAAAAGVKGAV